MAKRKADAPVQAHVASTICARVEIHPVRGPGNVVEAEVQTGCMLLRVVGGLIGNRLVVGLEGRDGNGQGDGEENNQ